MDTGIELLHVTHWGALMVNIKESIKGTDEEVGLFCFTRHGGSEAQ